MARRDDIELCGCGAIRVAGRPCTNCESRKTPIPQNLVEAANKREREREQKKKKVLAV